MLQKGRAWKSLVLALCIRKKKQRSPDWGSPRRGRTRWCHLQAQRWSRSRYSGGRSRGRMERRRLGRSSSSPDLDKAFKAQVDRVEAARQRMAKAKAVLDVVQVTYDRAAILAEAAKVQVRGGCGAALAPRRRFGARNSKKLDELRHRFAHNGGLEKMCGIQKAAGEGGAGGNPLNGIREGSQWGPTKHAGEFQDPHAEGRGASGALRGRRCCPGPEVGPWAGPGPSAALDVAYNPHEGQRSVRYGPVSDQVGVQSKRRRRSERVEVQPGRR